MGIPMWRPPMRHMGWLTICLSRCDGEFTRGKPVRLALKEGDGTFDIVEEWPIEG